MKEGKPTSRLALENHQPLSRSILWELQRRFFAAEGIDAWRRGVVPCYITSNPFVARAYSRVVRGFVRDCLARRVLIDHDQPMYIVELGAGSGRFAYQFLREFLASIERSRRNHVKFQYVMTDFASPTIDYWKTHPSLEPFVERGHVAFARFDAGHDRTIKLCGSGETLAPGTVSNPIIVLANYFFDSIPQDLFRIEGSELHEQLISVFAHDGGVNLDEPDVLERIQIAFDSRPIGDGYYDDPVLDELLQDYRHRLTDAAFSMPCAAIGCIRDLSRLSDQGMLLVAADQGYNSVEELPGPDEPVIDLHGSVSMKVNYHALGQYVLRRGGQVYHAGHRPVSLNVSCFVLGHPCDETPETRRAFDDAIVQFGPDDFFTLKISVERAYESLDAPQFLEYLRLSGYDADIFVGAFPALLKLVDSCTDEEREELLQVLQQVWEAYYPIGEELDLPFRIGVLLYTAAWYREALEAFRHSEKLHGPHSATYYDIGMCHYMLGEQESAQACVDEARRLDPECEEPPWSRGECSETLPPATHRSPR
jgi:tetratricopeptide (TPR) repeat protein